MTRHRSSIINLMNILLLLSLLIAPTISLATEEEDDVYLLATALFVADAQGKCILLDKALPIAVQEVIKEDALSHLQPTIRNKAIIKVVQKPAHVQPFELHTNTIKLDLRKMATRKNLLKTIADGLKDFWHYDIMRKGRGKSKNNKNGSISAKRGIIVDKGENDKHLNITKKDKLLSEAMGSGKGSLVKPSVTKSQLSSPNDYVPNDIYYSIEKKCVNWSDGCQLKSPPIFDHPSSTFKFSPGVLVPPKFELWDP